MEFKLSAGLYLFNTLLSFYFYWRVALTQRKAPALRFSGLFKRAILFLGIGRAIYTFFLIFFPNNSFYLYLSSVLGDPFSIIGFVYCFAAAIYLLKPEISPKKIIFPLGSLLAFLSIFTQLKFPFSPFFDENGIINWNLHPVPGLLYTLTAFAGFLPLGAVMLWQGIKVRKKRTSIILISSAILSFLISSIFSFILTPATPFTHLLDFLFHNLGFVLLFFFCFR